jgi:glycerophosphoryl diester phosphodiesterase
MRFTPQMRKLAWLVQRPIAHRGLHGHGVAENSSAAFAAAIAHQYSIECDIQITSDGEAVVFHDDTLQRMTGTKGRVAEISSANLRKLKLHGTDNTIPTLGDVLDQVAGQVTLVIEIKSHWNGRPELALRALDILKSYEGPVALMSFDPAIIKVLAHESPHTVRGIVADRVVDPYYQSLAVQGRINLRNFLHLHESSPHFISYDANGLPFEPVQQIRNAGFPVLTWTIRDQVTAKQARRYADQITFEGFLPE